MFSRVYLEWFYSVSEAPLRAADFPMDLPDAIGRLEPPPPPPPPPQSEVLRLKFLTLEWDFIDESMKQVCRISRIPRASIYTSISKRNLLSKRII